MRSPRRGFTLLEVMLAVVLLVTGSLVLLRAMSIGLFAGGDNESALIAITLSQEKMEELRNAGYVNIANETKAVVSGFPAFQSEVAVTAPQAGLKQANVTVYWFVKSAEVNTNLVTYISDI